MCRGGCTSAAEEDCESAKRDTECVYMRAVPSTLMSDRLYRTVAVAVLTLSEMGNGVRPIFNFFHFRFCKVLSVGQSSLYDLYEYGPVRVYSGSGSRYGRSASRRRSASGLDSSRPGSGPPTGQAPGGVDDK